MKLLKDLLGSLISPVEKYIVGKLVSYVLDNPHHLKLDKSWEITASVDQKLKCIYVSGARNGHGVFDLKLYPLAMTEAHQETLAALIEVLLTDGTKSAKALFSKIRGA